MQLRVRKDYVSVWGFQKTVAEDPDQYGEKALPPPPSGHAVPPTLILIGPGKNVSHGE